MNAQRRSKLPHRSPVQPPGTPRERQSLTVRQLIFSGIPNARRMARQSALQCT
jgi:hypothetical protein